MPNDNHDETALAPKGALRNRLQIVIVGLIVSGVLFGFFVSRGRDADYIELSGKRFKTEIMDTDKLRSQGLSGRDGLDIDASMLFVFKEPGQRCFWMNNMRFSIDILWFDSSKRLVHQEYAVSPETYPESYCVHNTQYVVELPSGSAEALGLELGDRLDTNR